WRHLQVALETDDSNRSANLQFAGRIAQRLDRIATAAKERGFQGSDAYDRAASLVDVEESAAAGPARLLAREARAPARPVSFAPGAGTVCATGDQVLDALAAEAYLSHWLEEPEACRAACDRALAILEARGDGNGARAVQFRDQRADAEAR